MINKINFAQGISNKNQIKNYKSNSLSMNVPQIGPFAVKRSFNNSHTIVLSYSGK